MDEEITDRNELHVAAIANTLEWLQTYVDHLENIMINGYNTDHPYFHDAMLQLESVQQFFELVVFIIFL